MIVNVSCAFYCLTAEKITFLLSIIIEIVAKHLVKKNKVGQKKYDNHRRLSDKFCL